LELNDKIFVRDIVAPVGEVISDPEILVLNIKPQVAEEEVEEELEEGEEGAEGTSEEGSEEDEDKKED